MKTIFTFILLLLASPPAQAAEPAVYYCEMKKKIAIDKDGRVKEYELTKFKFKDHKIVEIGEASIELGKGLGFPKWLENVVLNPLVYHGEDHWFGNDQYASLLYYFKDGELYLSTYTSEGLLSIVSECEKF